MKNRPNDTEIYASPFCAGYWRAAAREFGNVRSLVITALLTALSIAIGKLSIPIMTPSVQLSFSYIAFSLRSFLTGPLMAIPSAIISDIIGNLGSGYPFYPGYTLSAVLGSLIYALFLYRSRLSFSRIFLSKMTINLFVNVVIGSIWRTVLYNPDYMFNFAISGVKNAVMLPLEAFIIWAFFRAMLPWLKKLGLCPIEVKLTATKKQIIISAVVLALAVLLLVLFAKNYGAIKAFFK